MIMIEISWQLIIDIGYVKATQSGKHQYFIWLIDMSIICQHVHKLGLRMFFLNIVSDEI